MWSQLSDKDDDFEIPDNELGKWIETNPKVHAEKASGRRIKSIPASGKGLVRMVKYWNNNPKHGERPVKPSFLLEVMARFNASMAAWGGSFDREMQGFFATLADRIFDEWPDPAGLGPAISNGMDTARQNSERASLLRAAEREATLAIDHVRRGRNGEALRAWRELFGPKFPLS